MNSQVSAYLDSKGFEYKVVQRPSGLCAVMLCLFCGGGPKHEKCLSINLEHGGFKCMRENNCGVSGNFYQLQQHLGDKPQRAKFYKPNGIKPKTYSLPKVQTLSLSEKNLKYLHNRSFPDEIIKQFNLFNGGKGEICFPYFKDGRQVNIKYWDDKRPQGGKRELRQVANAESCLFNRDTTTGDILTITEGEFDCMALVQYGFDNVTSLPSGVDDHRWIENEWDFLERFNIIYLCMDNDPAGEKAINILVTRLGRWRCRSVVFPHKDANECLKAGISKEIMHKAFENAKEFPPNILKTAGNFYDDVADQFLNPEKYNGTDTGLPGLNHYLRGWRPGECTIWSGRDGSGKSTILDQIILFLASQRIRSCIASLELKPARYMKWMIQQAVGKEKPSMDEISRAFAWLDQWVYILDSAEETHPDEIFDVFEYAAKRYGVEHFIIDSLTRVGLPNKSDFELYAAQKKFVAQIMSFVKKYQVHCHLVAHPRKGSTDDSKPGKVDIAGTGDISYLADNVLVMWRPKNETKKDGDPDGVLYVRKNREFGDLGGVRLYFDKASRRFRCQDQQIEFWI